jgi:uncharacterized damage-inducible protein DinB
MYRTIDDFLADWSRESEGTFKLFSALTDESLSRKVSPEGRTLGFIAWHIVLSLGEMGARAGLAFDGPPEDAPEPARAADIAKTYGRTAAALLDAVKAAWTDASLDEEVNMYGEMWKKGFILSVLVRHEVHHRGQMTVLMRQAGLRVPGLCGPSREEWAQFGMPTQK